MKINRTTLYCFLIAIILRLLYLFTPQLDSDHAVIGLAGRHILKGEFPLFFYGTHFEGIIEGYIAALAFFLFGASRFVLDCVPALISLILLYVVYKLAEIIFDDKTARLALLFSSIAPSNFLRKVTIPMEGYIETAILGVVAFIITYKIIYTPKNLKKLYFLLGLTLGFSFYLHFHIIPFAVTVALFILLNEKKIILKKYIVFLLIGFLIGNSPLLIYNITHRWKTFQEIGKGIEGSTFIETLKHLFGYGYWVILGARIDGTNKLYIPYISKIITLVYLLSFIYLVLKRKKGSGLIITLLLLFPITYWLSGRGTVNTRRYLIPLYGVIPIAIAHFLNQIRERNKFISYGLIALILGSNIYTNIISIPIFNPNELTLYQSELVRDRQLYGFLKDKNIKGIYTYSWWISLKMNFDFKEDIIFTLFDDEPYPKYQKFVESQSNPAMVTYFEELIPTLDSIGSSYKIYMIPNPITNIPPYRVYYDFKPLEQKLVEIRPSNWTAYSSHNSKYAMWAIDRNIYTRWHSDTAQRKDMDFTIDIGRICDNVTKLCYHPGPSTDWPCGYELHTSIDGKEWNCIAKNTDFTMPVFWDGPHPFIRSINGLIEIDFPPQKVRYLKLVLTKDKEIFYWSITEIYIYRQKSPSGWTQKDWDLEKLKNRLNKIKPKKIFADPWITSNIDNKFCYISKDDTVYTNYIFKYCIVELNKLKDYAFIVLWENYPSFRKQLRDIKFNIEEFGPYILITFNENIPVSTRLYWDGFHLLKCRP